MRLYMHSVSVVSLALLSLQAQGFIPGASHGPGRVGSKLHSSPNSDDTPVAGLYTDADKMDARQIRTMVEAFAIRDRPFDTRAPWYTHPDGDFEPDAAGHPSWPYVHLMRPGEYLRLQEKKRSSTGSFLVPDSPEDLGIGSVPRGGMSYSTFATKGKSWVAFCRRSMWWAIDPATHDYIALKIRHVQPDLAEAWERSPNEEPAVLHLATREALMEFHSRYVTLVGPDGVKAPDWNVIKRQGWAGMFIDFQEDVHQAKCRAIIGREVPQDGVERAEWYYGWDCDSGNLWDLRAIENARKLDPAES